MPADRFQTLPQLASKPRLARFLAGLVLAIGLFFQASELWPQSPPSSKWTVTIILPTRLVAGRPATLAVLGADGRLASDVSLDLESGDLGSGPRVTTDATGRASFTAPTSGSVLIAKGSGASAVALVDQNPPDNPKDAILAPGVASLREPFSVCGSRFRSDADANHVRLNDEPALVMAASSECLAIMPGAKAVPGPAQITVQTPSGQWTAQTTLVSLEPEFPNPPLLPGKKGALMVAVRGSGQPLRVVVANQTPGVLRFLKGDVQELLTSGGNHNCATIEAEAIRSGDFSLAVRLLPSPDENAARRYLEAAIPLAEKGDQREIAHLARQLQHNPTHLDGPRRDVTKILSHTIESDLRTLLTAALNAL